MNRRTLIAIGIAVAFGAGAQRAGAAAILPVQASPAVAAAASSDALLAVEMNRSGIVDRIAAHHAQALAASGIALDDFRAALSLLRADQLLAASLVDNLDDVTAIVASMPSDSVSSQRFVAMTPTVPASIGELPGAESYVVRVGETLSIVEAKDLRSGSTMQVVGYLAPFSSGATIAYDSTPRVASKDGPGSGSGSWIGRAGGGNVASGSGSAVAAGTSNTADNLNAGIFAGQANSADGVSSLVIGGFDNHAVAIDSLVGAGAGNRATGPRSVVVGGGYNLASGKWSFIGGGGRETGAGNAGTSFEDNIAAGAFSVIGGGRANRSGTASASHATIGGGYDNTASGSSSSVAGGVSNTASGGNSTVSGGMSNTASGAAAAVSGGQANVASANSSTVSGGNSGLASGDYSVVAGGFINQATGTRAAVAGGANGVASGNYSTVGGGSGNTASGLESTVVGGNNNTASAPGAAVAGGAENVSSGASSMVAGGALNLAGGDFSFAAGRRAKVYVEGSFVFSDSTNADFTSGTANEFLVGATGGIGMYTAKNYSTGCHIVPGGGTWACTSSRDVKRDFAAIDTRQVLDKVMSLPLASWRYMNEADGIRHVGPMAQDFRAAFGLGEDDKTISTVDADGIALAAIQGLHRMLHQRDRDIVRLKARAAKVDRLERELRAIKHRLGMF
jgi:trimeric autotransporter adhesin